MKHTPFRAALCTIAIASLAGFASSTQGVDAVSRQTASRYCYAWDDVNTSGGDATGLRLNIAGVSQVDSVYTGADNPFGAADATSGFNVTTSNYALNFSNGTAFNGDTTHTGLCTSAPMLSLSSASWTSNGQTVGDPPHYLGLHFNWLSPGQLRVELTNPLPVTATLTTLTILQPEQPLALDDLTDAVASQLPMMTQAITIPVDLPPQGTYTIDVSFSQAAQLTVDQALVVDATLLPQDDPDNGTHLIAQTLGQVRKVNLPLVQR